MSLGNWCPFRPTFPPARIACAISERQAIGASAIRSPTAPTAARATPSRSTIPYDRPLTTMACFPMCEQCLREYEDPSNRRFHAQPNACPDCGPSLTLSMETAEPILDHVRQLLRQGRILAIKGLGGFHLVCDPLNDAAVRLLRERKKRSDKPFALMVPDVAAAEKLCFVSEDEHAALTSIRRPIVILAAPPRCPDFTGSRARQQHARRDAPVYAAASSAFRRVAVAVLVMTSGELERRAHRHRKSRGSGAPAIHRRCVPISQSRHSHSRGRFGGARLRRQGAHPAPFARLRTPSSDAEFSGG